MEAVIAATADAVSGSRPGARHNSWESHYQRILDLEDVAADYREVSQR